MKKLYVIAVTLLLSFTIVLAQEKQEKVGDTPQLNKVTKQVNADQTSGAIKVNSTAAVVTYDFTVAGAAYVNPSIPTPPMKVVDNIGGQDVYAMWNGDANNDGSVTNADKSPINTTKVFEGYNVSDLNFDGSVTNADRAVVNTNKPTTPQTHVPQ